MAVVVTAASGFDLGYVWKNQAEQAELERSAGGYYINAAQAGELPAAGGALVSGRWGSATDRSSNGGRTKWFTGSWIRGPGRS